MCKDAKVIFLSQETQNINSLGFIKVLILFCKSVNGAPTETKTVFSSSGLMTVSAGSNGCVY